MSVSPVQTFSIDNEDEADSYLGDLLANPAYRSMDEVERRAYNLIKDPRVKNYFLGRAKQMLDAKPT